MSEDSHLARELALNAALLAADRAQVAAKSPVLCYAMGFHRNDRGERLSFVNRRWLYDLYRAWGKEPQKETDVVFMKATQVGVTEMMLVLAWSWCGELGYRLMYVLPREEDRSTFYAMRVRKPLRHTPHYQALTKQTQFDSRSEYLLSIGRGSFRLAGSNAPATFVSVPLDAYVIDEIDRCNQDNILLAEDRLSWPDSRKVRIRVGNPTVSGFGISRLFESGSQHRWHVRCQACQEWIAADFFSHAVKEVTPGTFVARDEERANRPEAGDLRLVCACGGFLDRSGEGCWIARFPSRTRQSFHIGKLIDAAVSVRSLVERFFEAEQEPASLQRFWNSDLGLPYEPRGGKLTVATIRSRRFQYRDLPQSLWGPTRTMGIDVGSPHTVVVSDLPAGEQLHRILVAMGRVEALRERGPAFDPRIDPAPAKKRLPGVRRLLWAGKVKHLPDIDDLVRRYRPRCICIDAFPEVEAVVAARVRWGKILGSRHRIWRVQYLFDQLTDVGLDYGEGIAKVDRTHLLDLQVRDWMEGWRVVPQDVEELAKGAYVEELLVPTRVQEENARGIPVAKWTKGKDHFFHAEAYDRLAADLVQRGGLRTLDADILSGL